MKIASIIAGSAVVSQITLGAIVIIERLHAHLVTLHLGIGIVLYTMTILVTLYAWKITGKEKPSVSEIEKHTI